MYAISSHKVLKIYMNDKPIFKIRFILYVVMPTAAKIQYWFSEVLIPLFQQTMQPEKEVETLKIIFILAPALRKNTPRMTLYEISKLLLPISSENLPHWQYFPCLK